MPRTTGIATALTLALFACPAALHADEGWELLGQRQVNFAAERDTIPVTAAEGRFRRIRLNVLQNGVEIRDLTVHFANGEKHDVSVRNFIEKGGHTRAIDLPGALRTIKRVTLTYATRGRARRGRAMVKLFGFGRDRDGGREANEGQAPREEEDRWVRLGERRVNFAAEKDTIQVTASEGRFRRIRLRAKENGIEILWVKVTFGNGDKEEVTVRSFIDEGDYTRAIDLPGATRVIREVELAYRTRGAAREGRAHLVLFGYREGEGEESERPPEPAAPAQGGGGRWELLGQRGVSFRAERDSIQVTGKEGRFKRIRLKVEDNGVEFLDVTVHFGNGGKHDVSLRNFIAAGQHTRVIDLPGEARVIKRVTFNYRTRGRGRKGRATIKLFGKH